MFTNSTDTKDLYKHMQCAECVIFCSALFRGLVHTTHRQTHTCKYKQHSLSSASHWPVSCLLPIIETGNPLLLMPSFTHFSTSTRKSCITVWHHTFGNYTILYYAILIIICIHIIDRVSIDCQDETPPTPSSLTFWVQLEKADTWSQHQPEENTERRRRSTEESGVKCCGLAGTGRHRHRQGMRGRDAPLTNQKAHDSRLDSLTTSWY